jgi:hypothetical protein
MRRLLVATTFAALFASAAIAQTSNSPPPPNDPTNGAEVRPGSVGPGSEKNSQVSPTSPTIPMSAQPPPDIPHDAGTSGATTGESGKLEPVTPPAATGGATAQ